MVAWHHSRGRTDSAEPMKVGEAETRMTVQQNSRAFCGASAEEHETNSKRGGEEEDTVGAAKAAIYSGRVAANAAK